MTASGPETPDILSHFWTPLCAVGSHGPVGPNAQICVSVFGASIVPERPRLLVSLSNTNFTTGLVASSGTLAITLLSGSQVHLLEPLGLQSGRDRNKLAGISIERTPDGDPFFPAGVAMARCEVLEAMTTGDSSVFLCAVRERRALTGGSPLPWSRAREVVGDEFLQRWAQKSAREQEAARATMLWR